MNDNNNNNNNNNNNTKFENIFKTIYGNSIYSDLCYCDAKNKISFIFTPRGGSCTVFQQFLDLNGLLNEGLNYNKFIHKYRVDILDQNIITNYDINKLIEQNYTFIKFVTNPYIRAVSIFIAQRSHNLTFREYLKFLINNKVDFLNDNDKYHYHPQYVDGEEKIITKYVKIDENETFQIKLFDETLYTLDVSKYTSEHHSIRYNKNRVFCGDTPHDIIIYDLPNFYGYFYDDEIKKMVDIFYKNDIEYYNYSFHKLLINKTLIGKNNYLFLINDSAQELEVHCNNLNLVNKHNLIRYDLNNFLLIIIPNKSLIYKDYLPENYEVKYRPALKEYTDHFGRKIIDTYDILKNETNTYYKTDTHINVKGNYFVYKYFIEKVNEIYNLNLEVKEINFSSENCILTDLKYGIGDLLWEKNLGNQIVDDKTDVFYFSNDFEYIYNNYVIDNEKKIRILDKDNLNDITPDLHGTLLHWEVLSKYILLKKNKTKNMLKVVIFYDSFLLSLLDLYLELFEEVYMIKDIYNTIFINMIKPDYVFEFRVERFLF